MAGLVPENVTRLQTTAFVNNAALDVVGRVEIIRTAASKMAECALQKILDDCIETVGDYMGYEGQTLKLDVYVLTPAELHQMLIDARMQGEKDAIRWQSPAMT